MLAGEAPTATGPRYRAKGVRNDPPPVQRRLPILVGGSGEKVTLKLVARYADACNIGGGFETVRRKEEILRQHCATVGRDEREIERTAGIGRVFIRDSRAEARRVRATTLKANGGAAGDDGLAGTPEDLVEALAPYASIGYRHLIADFPAPHDEESITRLVREVRPKLADG
jgi:alkanesulfonate monooxygenase SsuD/methylene tetrahydromethanopterin reductase-like flavin-dependent oxidoreductase (luciferase family)